MQERKKQQGIFGPIPQAPLRTATQKLQAGGRWPEAEGSPVQLPQRLCSAASLGQAERCIMGWNGHSSPLLPVLPVCPILSIAQLHTTACGTLLSRQDSLVQHPQLLSGGNHLPDRVAFCPGTQTTDPNTPRGRPLKIPNHWTFLVFMGKRPASKGWEGVAADPIQMPGYQGIHSLSHACSSPVWNRISRTQNS